MANICKYEIHVKGSKNAARLVYESMPVADDKGITFEKGTEKEYELHFVGDCKWSVNYGVSDWNPCGKIAFDSLTEEEIEELGSELWDYSLRAKSGTFHCEIQVHYWSFESWFDKFDQYVNGKCVKQRCIPMIEDNYWRPGKEDPFEFDFYDPTEDTFGTEGLLEKNRNQNIEALRAGDPVNIRVVTVKGERKLEAFDARGLSLGYLQTFLSGRNSMFVKHPDYYDATVDSVTPLSVRKKTENARCRVARLQIKLTMKPERKAEYEKKRAEKEAAALTRDGVFRWDLLEFYGHEGENDENVDGEQRDAAFMNALSNVFGKLSE